MNTNGRERTEPEGEPTMTTTGTRDETANPGNRDTRAEAKAAKRTGAAGFRARARRARRRDQAAAVVDVPLPAPEVVAAPVAQLVTLSPGLVRNRWANRWGMYEAGPRGEATTTRQTEALRMTVAFRAGSEQALLAGVDPDTGEGVFSDPISDYAMSDGPNSLTRLIIGDVGYGKTTDLKCNAVLRPLLLGRRVVIIDKKRQGERGEYADLCQVLGVEPIAFNTNGTGTRVNIMDPRIGRLAGGELSRELVFAVLREALGRPVSELERKAVRVAVMGALTRAAKDGSEIDVRHLVPELLAPDADAARRSHVTAAELRGWGLECAFALERMVEEDLAGLVDGPTDSRVRLDGALTVFDLSALPDEGPAVPIVMAIINSWLTATLRSQRGAHVPTELVVEEGWHLVQGSFGEVMRRNGKLARGLGLVQNVALHGLADVPPDSPAMAMVRSAGTVDVFRQARPPDAAAVLATLGMDLNLVPTLGDLPAGTCVHWQSGRRSRLLTIVRSGIEADLANSDQVMLSTAQVSSVASVYEAELELTQ